MTTYLLLPAYNEELALTRLLPQVHAANPDIRVIVCDDGSSDRTAEITREHGYALIQHADNQGLAAAVRSLISYAARTALDNDVIVMMDGDGTMNPAQITAMSARLDEGFDVVIASRFQPGAIEKGTSVQRRLYSHGCRVLFQTLQPIPQVRDYTCGYRAYRALVLKQQVTLYPQIFDAPGFSAATELLLSLRLLGARMSEIPLILRYDEKPTASKMKVMRTIHEYLRLACTYPGHTVKKAHRAAVAQ